MAQLVEAVRLLLPSGITALRGRPSAGIQDWFLSATYAPDVAGSKLSLVGIDRQRALMALVCDTNRIASAASETLHNITTVHDQPKSAAWCLIKAYYAALFYGHVLLRLWGVSPTFFRTAELMPLRSMLTAYGIQSPVKLETGQFTIRLSRSVDEMEIHGAKGSGGSHEALWREFSRALDEMRHSIDNSQLVSADKTELRRLLSNAVDLMTNRGASASWLSKMRNDVQYRHAHGVWFPYTGKINTKNLLGELGAVLSNRTSAEDLSSSAGSDLSRFWTACLFIIALGRSSLNDADRLCGSSGPFRYGQNRYERSLPVREG